MLLLTLLLIEQVLEEGERGSDRDEEEGDEEKEWRAHNVRASNCCYRLRLIEWVREMRRRDERDRR